MFLHYSQRKNKITIFDQSQEAQNDWHFLWFCITLLHCVSDWLKILAPLSQPVRYKAKTNHAWFAQVFPCFAPTTCIWCYV